MIFEFDAVVYAPKDMDTAVGLIPLPLRGSSVALQAGDLVRVRIEVLQIASPKPNYTEEEGC
jgi:hypothetical protein